MKGVVINAFMQQLTKVSTLLNYTPSLSKYLLPLIFSSNFDHSAIQKIIANV
jgi:hypothetical protein